MVPKKVIERIRVEPGERFRLKDHDPARMVARALDRLGGKEQLEARAKKVLRKNLEDLAEAQELLWANDTYAILIVLQAMDAAGKDGTIRHVMSGLNPQGCDVRNFKQPSSEDLDHTFLWRCQKAVPERGRIGIFNRSYYEDVLVVRVHPELLERAKIPPGKRDDRFWEKRYDDINAFEHHLVRNGTIVLKFFLNVSKAEQKRRFLERIDLKEKHWKFSPSDAKERRFWDDYQEAYEKCIRATSTKWAPWYVVPADHKWTARALVADVVTAAVRRLHTSFPQPTKEHLAALAEAKRELLGK
jgi:PPK2 family polyphosphate:nucleotide phosphotransferase